MNTGNYAVDAVARMSFTGNVIPVKWLKTVTFEKSGKADLVSVMILSEIVYWYRPREVRCETTGQVLRYEKRFKSDLLQRSYDSFADQFGVSKRQAQDSMKRLEDIGVIKRVFRTVKTSNSVASNVLFIELNVEKLAEITYETASTDVTPITFERDTSLHSNVTPPTFERDTYTETTTEITTDIYPSSEAEGIPTGDATHKNKNNSAKQKSNPITLETFIENCEKNDERPIADYKPVFDYAEKIGLPTHMLNLAWLEFRRRFTEIDSNKRYKDWRRAFLNCVTNNWYKLWWLEGSDYQLTTQGKQAMALHKELQ